MAATLAGVLGAFGRAYLAGYSLSSAQARVWRAIEACRTLSMGGRHPQCDGCGREQWLFNSAACRHCPQCQSGARDAQRQARLAELLPVPYCHLVFTLPHAINALAQWHPRWVYKTLMQCTAATLTEFAANPRWLGATGAGALVLHTWTQDLRLHLHAHAVMACGGLDAQGHWVAPKRSPTFLFPVHALQAVFKAKFIKALRAAENGDELARDPSNTPSAGQLRLNAPNRHDGVVTAKTPLAGREAVLDYLSRYTHRVAVSNERILSRDAAGVRLSVRADNKGTRAASESSPSTGRNSLLDSCNTVCPAASNASCPYCQLSPALKTERMATARAALNLPAASAPAREDAAQFLKRVAQRDATRCPHCALGRWRTLATARPANATNATNAANAANVKNVANAKAQVPRRGPP